MFLYFFIFIFGDIGDWTQGCGILGNCSTIFLALGFFRQGFVAMWLRLPLNLPCSLGCPRTYDPPASASLMLGLQVCTMMAWLHVPFQVLIR
jgi:hypothetical protein